MASILWAVKRMAEGKKVARKYEPSSHAYRFDDDGRVIDENGDYLTLDRNDLTAIDWILR
jgi:hypothetical protein